MFSTESSCIFLDIMEYYKFDIMFDVQFTFSDNDSSQFLSFNTY